MNEVLKRQENAKKKLEKEQKPSNNLKMNEADAM